MIRFGWKIGIKRSLVILLTNAVGNIPAQFSQFVQLNIENFYLLRSLMKTLFELFFVIG